MPNSINLKETVHAGELNEWSEENTSTFGYVLEEEGNDYLSVDVKKVDMNKVYDKLLSSKEITQSEYNDLVKSYKKDNLN